MKFHCSFFFTIVILLLSSCLQLVRTSETDEDKTKDGASIPGHLEPLASKNVKHSLEVIQNYPDPKTFFETYVVPSKPVLIPNAAKLSPAFDKWRRDEYFLSRPESSEETVHVEQRKKEERTAPYNEIPFSEFVKSYNEKDIYMVSSVPKFMKSDVVLPRPLLCRDITESNMLTDAVMWFSSGGTKSVLHHDDGLENINCLFAGTKEFLFIDYHKYKHVVPIDFPAGRYSGVDVDRVDFVKYPGLIDVEYYNVTLQTGDCLYIPHRWFHQVRSYGRNIAVNLWWQYTPDFVPKDCDGVEQNQTLDKFNFTTLDKIIEEPETTLLSHLEHFLGKKYEISFKTFIKRLKKDPSFGNNNDIRWTEDMKSSTKKLFKLIDVDEDKSFSTADLEELEQADDETIRAVTDEYYRLYDLMELSQDNVKDELYEEDYEDGAGDGDYDIDPVEKSGKAYDREEL